MWLQNFLHAVRLNESGQRNTQHSVMYVKYNNDNDDDDADDDDDDDRCLFLQYCI